MINYREWTEQDAVELQRLLSELHESMRPYDENYPPAPVIIERYFHYLTTEIAETSGAFFLAEEDDRPIGFICIFGLMPPFAPDEDPTKFSFISDLYVEPAYRGQGIGKALLARAEAYGKSLGAPRIELATHAANPAMAQYQHLGYHQRLVIMSKLLDR